MINSRSRHERRNILRLGNYNMWTGPSIFLSVVSLVVSLRNALLALILESEMIAYNSNTFRIGLVRVFLESWLSTLITMNVVVFVGT